MRLITLSRALQEQSHCSKQITQEPQSLLGENFSLQSSASNCKNLQEKKIGRCSSSWSTEPGYTYTLSHAGHALSMSSTRMHSMIPFIDEAIVSTRNKAIPVSTMGSALHHISRLYHNFEVLHTITLPTSLLQPNLKIHLTEANGHFSQHRIFWLCASLACLYKTKTGL